MIVKQIKNYCLLPVVTAALLFVFAGCGSAPLFQSAWEPQAGIQTMDAKAWGPSLKTINNKTSFYFAAKNDNDYVTLRLVTSNMLDIMKVMHSGLTISIEPPKGDKFGIQFPVQKLADRPEEGQFSPEKGARNAEERVKQDIDRQDEFFLVDEKNNPISSYLVMNATDIKPKLSYESGQLVYQVQIPLGRKIDKYMDVSLNPGDVLSVSIATMEIKHKESFGKGSGGREMGEGGGPGGEEGGYGGQGGGGGRGGRGPGGPGGAGGPGMKQMTPIDLDLKVGLSSASGGQGK